MAEGDYELAGELLKALGVDLSETELPHLTDSGNAKWLKILRGEDLRHCWPTKTFHCWDGTRWVPDNQGQVDWWARDVAHKYYEMAATLNTQVAEFNTQAASETDPSQSQALAEKALKNGGIAKTYTAWAKKTEASERMAAIVRWVRSEPGIPIQPEDMDKDPWQLNCLNGTIDLRTGELKEHKREDFITKICPVEYIPDATFLLWDQFLERIQPDPEMRDFLQRAAGYAITGFSTEEKLFFSYGEGNTGKSTFLQAISRTLGGYATTADFDTFLQKDRSAGHSADIAKLAGARLVISTEVEEGKRMAESLVKQLTGGDTISASFKFQNSFDFLPTFQLWIAANNRPRVRSDDNAMWRRILQLPFVEVIPEAERDPAVKSTLTDVDVAGSAIMAWLVQGCLLWQQEGLKPPHQVIAATAEYRDEMDPLKEFVDDRCVVKEDAKADNTELYQLYQRYAGEVGIRRPLGRKAFTQSMKSKGFSQQRDNAKRYWGGIGILGDPTLFT